MIIRKMKKKENLEKKRNEKGNKVKKKELLKELG